MLEVLLFLLCACLLLLFRRWVVLLLWVLQHMAMLRIRYCSYRARLQAGSVGFYKMLAMREIV